MNAAKPQGNETGTGADFLPDFCSAPNLLVVVLATQLLALLLVLTRSELGMGFWVDLGVVSLFLQWLALVCAGLVCVMRRPLAERPRLQAAALTYLALVAAILLLSLLAWHLADWSGLGSPWLPADQGQFLFRNTAIGAIVAGVMLRYFHIQNQWKQNVQREATARIEALQARIRPHFLFNSLNTVAALITVRPERAEQAVEDLSDLFRASLSDTPDGVSLADEMSLARRYLNLEGLRLGDRLDVDWRVRDEDLERVRVPRLIIQPLVENAVYHGIETRPEGGRVEVTATPHADHVEVLIENPLPDTDQRPTARRGHQMALDNVTQRLRLKLGPQARLETRRTESRFTTRLRLPREEE
ncbi:sensor histidine kinase [Natronospira bacteriovora]|uniref:Sensor histidine kinase n=1 Tax=Natronospira bacteriovora TaxID=3069753 RepID=A0ABU0WA57_9GAMM|nr:sensor histidine kinase [Natronospira sp. AB-CW4]MDQ2069840.1 sensor histidine kinase [Natronospira sp. AB-CW4]